MKSIDLKFIRDFAHDRRPIDQFPVGLESRAADTGPIRRNDSHTEIARGLIRQFRHRARARPTVAKKHGCSVGIAVFVACNAPAGLKRD